MNNKVQNLDRVDNRIKAIKQLENSIGSFHGSQVILELTTLKGVQGCETLISGETLDKISAILITDLKKDLDFKASLLKSNVDKINTFLCEDN